MNELVKDNTTNFSKDPALLRPIFEIAQKISESPVIGITGVVFLLLFSKSYRESLNIFEDTE